MPGAPGERRYPNARLGVYVDDVYLVSRAQGEDRISTDRAFLLYACEVGGHFGGLVLFGRTARADAPAEYVLPARVELVELPYYEHLRRPAEVVGAAPRTIAAMWRGLGRVDRVWVFGPHPFALVLALLGLVRRKKVVLGVRQDTMAYFRPRLPNRSWAPVLLFVRALDASYRLLARRLRTTVVGAQVASHYGGPGPNVLQTTVSLVRAADVAPAPLERDWAGTIELLSVARLDPDKNPMLLVEAFAELERRRPGRYRLTWIGRGDLEAAVDARAAALGVASRIERLGYVPFGPELLDVYRRAHAFVHVSLQEGAPQVLVEALACGTAVVATDVGGVRALLDGGTAGLIVPPGDAEAVVAAVLRISDDERLRDALVARGLELARGMTLESEAERVAAFLAG